MIEHLHEYGVTWIYTESRRFKTSATAAKKQLVSLATTNRLIQAVPNNFGANLSTQNRLTHSLVTVFIQNGNVITKRKPIPRYTNTDFSNVQLEEPQIQF